MWSVFKTLSASRASDTQSARNADAASQGMLAIWSRQIDNVREQTESAIVGLTAHFSGITEKLDASISKSQRHSELQAREAAQDGQQAETNLSLVIQSLREIQASRTELAREIAAIVAYTGELQKMADEVKAIAFQTNMLSLNAAIEAAHAGENGKGFAVVAHEVGILSKASRDTGQNIHQRTTAISDALLKIAEHNHAVTTQDQEAIARSEASIGKVLERQRERAQQFTSVAASSRADSTAIKNEIEDSLVQLQFQDRVSQILAQISTSMNEIAHDAPTGNDADVNYQLAHLASTYTTEEQRTIHAGFEAAAVAPRAVTYF